MKTGLFFGSFNPIHTGHLIIGSHLAEFTDLQQVWYVVSPHNPLKEKKELLNEYERLELVRIATDDDPRLRASDIEFQLPRPSYTINTLLHLQEKYPEREWALIMGSDNLETLPKWKNYEQLLSNYDMYIYPRPGHDTSLLNLPPRATIVENTPVMQISASFIRQSIRSGHSVRYLLTDKVWQYVDKWGHYL